MAALSALPLYTELNEGGGELAHSRARQPAFSTATDIEPSSSSLQGLQGPRPNPPKEAPTLSSKRPCSPTSRNPTKLASKVLHFVCVVDGIGFGLRAIPPPPPPIPPPPAKRPRRWRGEVGKELRIRLRQMV